MNGDDAVMICFGHGYGLAFTSSRDLHKVTGTVARCPDIPCVCPIPSWHRPRFSCGGATAGGALAFLWFCLLRNVVVVDVHSIINMPRCRKGGKQACSDGRECRDSEARRNVPAITVTWIVRFDTQAGHQTAERHRGERPEKARTTHEGACLFFGRRISCDGSDGSARQPASTIFRSVFVERESGTVQDEADSARLLRTIRGGTSHLEYGKRRKQSSELHVVNLVPARSGMEGPFVP